MMDNERFQRNIECFGKIGQENLFKTTITIVGYGGLGSHVLQEIAYLGVGSIQVIEPGILKASNRNRYIGSRASDIGKPKILIADRMIQEIAPEIRLKLIQNRLESIEAFDAIKTADFVFGCVDNDGARFILNELCLAYEIPLLDLASDVLVDGCYGGRVAVVRDGVGCLYCMNELSAEDIRRYLSSEEQLEHEAAIYGISVDLLKPETGPSVVSLNGVIASLGVEMFREIVSSKFTTTKLLKYYGHLKSLRKSIDLDPGCFYCNEIRGKRKEANVERYLDQFTINTTEINVH